MAKINIRGIGVITRSREIAEDIRKFKNDHQYLPNDKYIKHGLDVEKRDIGGIDTDDFVSDDREASSERKDENDKYYQEQNLIYEKDIKRRCSLNPLEKAKDTKLMEIVYESFGEKVTQAFLDEVIKRQTEYFTANPRHPFPRISIKDLTSNKDRDNQDHFSGIFPSVVINKIYLSMDQGLFTARKLRLV